MLRCAYRVKVSAGVSKAANQTAWPSFVVGIILQEHTILQCVQQLGRGDILLSHLLLRMKGEVNGPASRFRPDDLFDPFRHFMSRRLLLGLRLMLPSVDGIRGQVTGQRSRFDVSEPPDKNSVGVLGGCRHNVVVLL